MSASINQARRLVNKNGLGKVQGVYFTCINGQVSIRAHYYATEVAALLRQAGWDYTTEYVTEYTAFPYTRFDLAQ